LINFFILQQGKFSEAEKSIKTLNGKERVADVMTDLTVGSQGSAEPEAGWFDLFSSRYWKGTWFQKKNVDLWLLDLQVTF
jgi:hypothetical protein